MYIVECEELESQSRNTGFQRSKYTTVILDKIQICVKFQIQKISGGINKNYFVRDKKYKAFTWHRFHFSLKSVMAAEIDLAAGLIVFRIIHQNNSKHLEYLLLQMKAEHRRHNWGPPKGKLEWTSAISGFMIHDTHEK